MYGLYERVVSLTGGKYRELATDRTQKFSYPITGRLSLGKYDLLIVTPATANTVAKIVHGISDTLVTNAVAQAGKGAVKTLIVPVDIHPVLLIQFYLQKWKFLNVRIAVSVLHL